MIGLGLGAIPITVFSLLGIGIAITASSPLGIVAASLGFVAGVCLLWMALIFRRSDIVPVAVVVVCQLIGAGTAVPMGMSDFWGSVYAFFGALVGAVFGFILNYCVRKWVRKPLEARQQAESSLE